MSAPLTGVDLDRAVAVRPSPRQLAWQQLDFTGFIHFGMNTMTDREWGLGHEDPALFDPQHVDTDQWIAALSSAGMTGVILTAKHHDGFCLWPTATTTHSVASSPWRGGQGDLVREVAESARRAGLRFGIYLSPWDRTDPSYGQGRAYDDLYLAQLRELLTGYGDVFAVWLDGANGEGPNGRRQTYDWERWFALVRELQPGAVISICGPDVRWCGNEAGHTRADEWSVVPAGLRDAERTSERSQQADDGTFASLVRSDDQDLGSRAAISGHEDDLAWYPAEVNTSVRPGWFHHPAEDRLVRDADELFAIHQQAVGGNAGFLLNVPPTRDGLVAAPDVAALAELGRRIADQATRVRTGRLRISSGVVGPAASLPTGRDTTSATDARGDADHPRTDIDGARLHPGCPTDVWAADPSDDAPTITLTLPHATWIDGLVLREDIASGQRIEHVVVSGCRNGAVVDSRLAEFGVVGNRRIVRFDPALVDTVVVRIDRCRAAPRLSGVAVLEERRTAS
ncbi:alpha-L-fucosidase [Microbacterium sp. M1A1_1b]